MLAKINKINKSWAKNPNTLRFDILKLNWFCRKTKFLFVFVANKNVRPTEPI